MSVEQKVKQIIVEQLGVDEAQVDPTASFVDDLGADSLDIVELVMAFEEAFDLDIPDEIKPLYSGNYGLYADLIVTRLAPHYESRALAETMVAFQKLFMFDVTLAIEAYIAFGMMARMQEVTGALLASTDLLSLSSGEVVSTRPSMRTWRSSSLQKNSRAPCGLTRSSCALRLS